MGIVRAVRVKPCVRSAVDEDLEAAAVRKNGRVLPRPGGSLWSEIPVEVWFDDRSNAWIDLSDIEARAQLRNAKDVDDARALHAVVRIDQTAVVERAPRDHSGAPWIVRASIVCLRVPDCLLLLQVDLASAPIPRIEVLLRVVIE